MRGLLALVLLLFAAMYYYRPAARNERVRAAGAPAAARTEAPVPASASSPVSQARASSGSAALQGTPGRSATRVAVPVESLPVQPVAGARAPAMRAMSVSFGMERRLEDFPGQVKVLYVWTTWCPRCKDDMPALEAIYQAYRGRGVVVLAVAANGTHDALRATARERGYSFEILRDIDDKTAKAFLVRGYPYSAIIDRHGVIRNIRVGYSPDNYSEDVQLIDRLLGEWTR